VDDDSMIAFSTAAMLEDLGHVVIEATSGEMAMDLLKSDPNVDFIITDHAMPGMSGTELAAEVSRSWPDIPIVLASGYAELPNGEDPSLLRLEKPYRQEDLAAAIEKLVGRARASNVLTFRTDRRAL